MRFPAAWSICALIAALVGGATLATAWICDDALVTLRTVENFVAGDGLRWNVLDRTQTATHPLWILLLAAVRLVTGEPYFTTLGVGITLTALSVLVLARNAGSSLAAMMVVGFGALGSRAFIEFGTCGLENPLVYALLALFLREWVQDAGWRRLRRLALLGALLALARQDVVLLIAPCILMAMRGLSWREIGRALGPGFAVGMAWYSFALVYYGTILPTPAYGKVVSADVASGALFEQGLRYFIDVAGRDPTTILVLGAAIVAGCIRPTVLKTTLSIGVLLQLVYVLRVGGDFMSGRFFTAAFVLALFGLARSVSGKTVLVVGCGLAISAIVVGPPSWTKPTPTRAEAQIAHGIGDERAYYAETLGLWSPTRIVPEHGQHAQFFAGHQRPVVVLATTAGAYGFLGGARVHVVEPFLCDPLLMRLPLQDPEDWRIGHFKRRIPEGYLETLASGENRIHHPALAEYWHALEVVLRAPVFSSERWGTLLAFWAGDYDALLARYVEEEYLPPPLVERTVSQLQPNAQTSPGTHWYDAPCVVVREGGLRVRRGDVRAVRKLRLLVDGGGDGELRFRRGDAGAGRVRVTTPVELFGGARWLSFDVPEAAADFDAVDIMLETRDLDPRVDTLQVFAVLAIDVSE